MDKIGGGKPAFFGSAEQIKEGTKQKSRCRAVAAPCNGAKGRGHGRPARSVSIKGKMVHKVKIVTEDRAQGDIVATAFTGHKIWVASWQILMPCATALALPKPSRTQDSWGRGQWKVRTGFGGG